jgi:hypothetical protein
MAMDQIVELFLMDIPKLLEEKSFAIEIVDFFSWRLQNSEKFCHGDSRTLLLWLLNKH